MIWTVLQNTEGGEMGAGLVKGRKNLCWGVLNVRCPIISPSGDANWRLDIWIWGLERSGLQKNTFEIMELLLRFSFFPMKLCNLVLQVSFRSSFILYVFVFWEKKKQRYDWINLVEDQTNYFHSLPSHIQLFCNPMNCWWDFSGKNTRVSCHFLL